MANTDFQRIHNRFDNLFKNHLWTWTVANILNIGAIFPPEITVGAYLDPPGQHEHGRAGSHRGHVERFQVVDYILKHVQTLK